MNTGSKGETTMNNDVQATSRAVPHARPGDDGARYETAALTPPVDVIEDAGGITLCADLPGVTREGLNLHIEADTLTIDAESSLKVPDGLKTSHTEVALGRFRRVFTLSKELDTEKVAAELTQGVLKLRIPKASHAQPRRIQVSVT
jgi:HSP20 family protein